VSSLLLIFLVPLLSGFIINRSAYELKYVMAHESGYGSVFMALISGFLLYLFCAHYITSINLLFSMFPEAIWPETIKQAGRYLANPIVQIIENVSAADKIETPIISPYASAMTLYTSLIIALFCKLKLKKNELMDKKYNEKAHIYYGGPLEALLIEAKNKDLPLLITLKTKKVYVCFVKQLYSFFPHHKSKHIRFSVLASGYRDKDTLSLKITNRYDFVQAIPYAFSNYISELEEKEKRVTLNEKELIYVEGEKDSIEVPHELLSSIYDEGLVVDLNEIATATIWSEEIYDLFIPQDSAKEGFMGKLSSLIKDELRA
jgi:hypothetical protein